MLNGGYGQILDEALQKGCQGGDQAALGFFRSPRVGERPRRPLTFQRWVSAPIGLEDDTEALRAISQAVADELVATPSQVMRELIAGPPRLLPGLPVWNDGSTLFDAHSVRTGRHRFNVVGGNRLYSAGDVVRDLKRSYARLLMLNTRRPFSRADPLRVYCPVQRVEELEQARDEVLFDFAVDGQAELKADDPWVLARDRPIVVLKVIRPAGNVPCPESGIVFGAGFMVWLDDPLSAVRVEPEPD